MTYYAAQSAADIGDVLRSALGSNSGSIGEKQDRAVTVDINANGVTIDTYELPPA
jgi:hypothetical protein